MTSVTRNTIHCVGLSPTRAAEGVLGGVENGVCHLRRNVAARTAALEVAGGFGLEPVGGGQRIERRAALELVEEIGRLGLQSRCDFVVTPALGDLILDFIERAVARRRDRGDVVPDIAAVGVDRIVVDADVGRKRSVDDVGGVSEVRDRLAVGIAAGAVDGVSDERQFLLLRRLLQRGAAGAVVFDLVVEVGDLRLGAVERDVVAQLGGGVGERLVTCGSILSTVRSTTPNCACTGALTSPSLSAKATSATAGSTIAGFDTSPRSMSVSLSPRSVAMAPKLVPDLMRSAAACASAIVGNTICSICRRSGVVKLDRPLVIGLFDVVVGNLHPLRQRRRRHRDGIDLAVVRGAEQDFALVEIFAELRVGRRRNVAGLRRAERYIRDAALFVLELIDGVEPGLRRRDAAGYAVDDLAAQHALPLFGDIALLAIAHVLQHHLKPLAIEIAVHVLQMRIGRRCAGRCRRRPGQAPSDGRADRARRRRSCRPGPAG